MPLLQVLLLVLILVAVAAGVKLQLQFVAVAALLLKLLSSTHHPCHLGWLPFQAHHCLLLQLSGLMSAGGHLMYLQGVRAGFGACTTANSTTVRLVTY
jgi:hypothetical protein